MSESRQQRGVAPSPFFRPSTPHVVVASNGETISTTSMEIQPTTPVVEHKSGLFGCAANLMTCIVGSGIVGIPYAVKQAVRNLQKSKQTIQAHDRYTDKRIPFFLFVGFWSRSRFDITDRTDYGKVLAHARGNGQTRARTIV